MADDVTVKFGFLGTDLTKGIQAAEKQVKGMAEGMSRLGVGAGVMAAFGIAVKEVFEYSRNLTGELNSSEIAARNAARAATSLFAEVKDGALRAGANVIGWVNQAGEGIGSLATRWLQWNKLIGDDAQRNQKISADAEESIRRSTEWIQKNGEVHKQLNAELLKAEEAKKQAAFEAQNLTTQLLQLKAKERDLEEQIAKVGATSVEGKKLRVKLAETEAALVKVTKSETEELAKKEKEANEQKAKALEAVRKAYKETALTQEEEVELVRLHNKAADQLTREEKKRLEVLEAQKKIKENEIRISKILEDNGGKLTKEQSAQVVALADQNAKLHEQVDKLQPKQIEQENKVTDAIEGQNAALDEQAAKKRSIVAIDRTGSLASLDEYDLNQLGKTISTNLQASRQHAFSEGRNPDWEPGVIMLQNELANVEKAIADLRERERYQRIKDAYLQKQGAQVVDSTAEQNKLLAGILSEQQRIRRMFKNEGMTEIEQGGKG